MDFSLETAVLWVVPVVLAITLHEAAHGYVARIFGDQTAWMLGRVTLNPLKHIDPLWAVVLPGVLIFLGLPAIGMAKPVPVNFGNLRHPKRDMIWVAGAGPLANFVMALGWAFLLSATAPSGPWASNGVYVMANAGVSINLALLALNLLPVPPLDGGRIAVGLLPNKASMMLARVEPYGFFIVLALIAIPGALWTILKPIYRVFETLVYSLAGF